MSVFVVESVSYLVTMGWISTAATMFNLSINRCLKKNTATAD